MLLVKSSRLCERHYVRSACDYDHFICNDCGCWGPGTPMRCPNCGSSFVSHY